MAIKHRIVIYAQKIKESTHLKLQSDEERHEHVNTWSNRDLIPLPPSRRTWGFTSYFGFWTLASLNISNWQSPNTFLSKLHSLSGQSFDYRNIQREVIPYQRLLEVRVWDLHPVLIECLCSRGAVSSTSHGRLNGCQCLGAALRHNHRSLRLEMAHWIHAAESLYMGHARQLYSALAESLIEFYLDCCSMLEWRETCCVSAIHFGKSN